MALGGGVKCSPEGLLQEGRRQSSPRDCHPHGPPVLHSPQHRTLLSSEAFRVAAVPRKRFFQSFVTRTVNRSSQHTCIFKPKAQIMSSPWSAGGRRGDAAVALLLVPPHKPWVQTSALGMARVVPAQPREQAGSQSSLKTLPPQG